MIDPFLALALAGGGYAVVTAASKDSSKGTMKSGGETRAEVTASTIRASLLQPKTAGAGVVGARQVGMVAGTQAEVMAARQLAAARKKLEEEYNKLTDEGRKAGAAAINETLGTKLTGDEDFETAAAIVGAAVGAAGGATVGGAIGGPVGAAAGKYLGAMAGAYLGAEAGDWLDGAWDDVKDWGGDAYDTVEGWAEDAWGWIS